MLLVALGGLFAMHGLSDHAVGPVDVSAPVSVTHGGEHGVEHGGDQGGNQGGNEDHHEDHHEGLVVGACVAVLAAMVLTGLGAWRSGSATRLRAALVGVPAAAVSASVQARARGPAPPDLTLLCVQRC